MVAILRIVRNVISIETEKIMRKKQWLENFPVTLTLQFYHEPEYYG